MTCRDIGTFCLVIMLRRRIWHPKMAIKTNDSSTFLSILGDDKTATNGGELKAKDCNATMSRQGKWELEPKCGWGLTSECQSMAETYQNSHSRAKGNWLWLSYHRGLRKDSIWFHSIRLEWQGIGIRIRITLHLTHRRVTFHKWKPGPLYLLFIYFFVSFWSWFGSRLLSFEWFLPLQLQF